MMNILSKLFKNDPKPALRTTLSTYKDMSETINIWLKNNPKEVYSNYLKGNKEIFGTDEWINFEPIVKTNSLRPMECVSYAYTRGDSMEWIKTTIVQPAVENLLVACDEIELRDRKGQYFFWGHHKSFYNQIALDKSQVLSIFTFMAWLICFQVDREKIIRFIPFIAPQGIDPLVDTILKAYQPERKVGHNNPNEKAYKKPIYERWHEIGNAKGEEQIALIHAYLDDWAMLLSQRPKGKGELDGIYSLGLSLYWEHSSNKTLPREVTDTAKKSTEYTGHWAWEVVLFVKFFKIDDSSFRDHPLYPVELVDYKQ